MEGERGVDAEDPNWTWRAWYSPRVCTFPMSEALSGQNTVETRAESLTGHIGHRAWNHLPATNRRHYDLVRLHSWRVQDQPSRGLRY